MLLAIVTMLMVVGNVAFAAHVFYEERPGSPDGHRRCKWKITCTSHNEDDCTEELMYCYNV
ncbi:hypothetical protein [Dethiothermospora halolimnae]|uniref:hypothetical protein n=1 Tax=Dethiothermospora halolimnae TaxID=3114390 RepID=UPI003CCBF572